MSALLTHGAIGLLLGVAVRLPARYLPLAAFLAMAPDLDHLAEYTAIPFGESRVTFHNVLVLVAIPVALYLWLTWRGAKPQHRQLAGAAPLLLASHLALDLLPLDPLGGGGWAAVWYPFSSEILTLPYSHLKAADPREYSTFTLLLVLLAGLALLALAAHRATTPPQGDAPRRRVALVAGAYAAAWLLLFPGLAAAGAFEPKPEHANGAYTLKDAQVDLPWGRFTATVFNHGGNAAGAGALRLEVLADGVLLASETNPARLAPGTRWNLDLALPGDVRAMPALEARLVATKDAHRYDAAKVEVAKGHVDVPIVLRGVRMDGATWVVTIRNDGNETVPAGALVVRVTSGGRTVDAAVVEGALPGRGEAAVRVTGVSGAGLAVKDVPFVSVEAVDDGWGYVRRSVGAG